MQIPDETLINQAITAISAVVALLIGLLLRRVQSDIKSKASSADLERLEKIFAEMKAEHKDDLSDLSDRHDKELDELKAELKAVSSGVAALQQSINSNHIATLQALKAIL